MNVTTTTPRALAVRRAGIADLPTVVELRLALLREHGGNAVYRRLRPDAEKRAYELFRAQLEADDQITLLAERDARAVGILRCADTVGSPLLYPSRYAYVSSVYVVPSGRRNGVLRAMFAVAESWAAARGLGEMRLHNVPENPASAGAWDALGFGIVEHLRFRQITSE